MRPPRPHRALCRRAKFPKAAPECSERALASLRLSFRQPRCTSHPTQQQQQQQQQSLVDIVHQLVTFGPASGNASRLLRAANTAEPNLVNFKTAVVLRPVFLLLGWTTNRLGTTSIPAEPSARSLGLSATTSRRILSIIVRVRGAGIHVSCSCQPLQTSGPRRVNSRNSFS
jgi:hypothetical protein